MSSYLYKHMMLKTDEARSFIILNITGNLKNESGMFWIEIYHLTLFREVSQDKTQLCV